MNADAPCFVPTSFANRVLSPPADPVEFVTLMTVPPAPQAPPGKPLESTPQLKPSHKKINYQRARSRWSKHALSLPPSSSQSSEETAAGAAEEDTTVTEGASTIPRAPNELVETNNPNFTHIEAEIAKASQPIIDFTPEYTAMVRKNSVGGTSVQHKSVKREKLLRSLLVNFIESREKNNHGDCSPEAEANITNLIKTVSAKNLQIVDKTSKSSVILLATKTNSSEIIEAALNQTMGVGVYHFNSANETPLAVAVKDTNIIGLDMMLLRSQRVNSNNSKKDARTSIYVGSNACLYCPFLLSISLGKKKIVMKFLSMVQQSSWLRTNLNLGLSVACVGVCKGDVDVSVVEKLVKSGASPHAIVRNLIYRDEKGRKKRLETSALKLVAVKLNNLGLLNNLLGWFAEVQPGLNSRARQKALKDGVSVENFAKFEEKKKKQFDEQTGVIWHDLLSVFSANGAGNNELDKKKIHIASVMLKKFGFQDLEKLRELCSAFYTPSFVNFDTTRPPRARSRKEIVCDGVLIVEGGEEIDINIADFTGRVKSAMANLSFQQKATEINAAGGAADGAERKNEIRIDDLSRKIAHIIVDFCHHGGELERINDFDVLLELVITGDYLLCPSLISSAAQRLLQTNLGRFTLGGGDIRHKITPFDCESAFKVLSVCRHVAKRFHKKAKLSDLKFCAVFCLLHFFHLCIDDEHDEVAFLKELLSELHI